jgi:hypothetical protein
MAENRVPLSDLAEIAEIVRSKNAGPSWVTRDVIYRDSCAYERVGEPANDQHADGRPSVPG